MDNKLLFFNSEGYPYNFEWNSTDEAYDGTLFFDRNSNDTFKSLYLYVFEEVPPMEFGGNYQLDKFEIYSSSGISFIPYTYSGLTITNINKVNSATGFYSKWIYGNNFDSYFPKGTIVSFSGLSFNTSTTDFTEKYYTVIDNKPNAILINSETENSSWNKTFVTGGTIYSHNVIMYYDYDDSISNYITSHNSILYEDKKLSIYDSANNDGINVFHDYEFNKTFYQKYLLTGTTNDTLKIDFILKTERAKLYQGSASFILTGGTAYITFNRKLNNTINLTEDEQIIFEDFNDNPIISSNPIFTIVDGITEFDLYEGNVNFTKELNTNATFIRHFNSKDLSSQNFVNNTTLNDFNNNVSYYTSIYPSNFFEYDYYLEITGTTSDFDYTLTATDKIFLTGLTSTCKNNNRELKVLEIKTFYQQRIDYWTNKINTSSSWINKVKEESIANSKTLIEQIEIEAINMYNTNDINESSSNFIPIADRTEKIKVENYIIEEFDSYELKKKLTIDEISTIECTYSPALYYSAFTMDVIAYDTTNILSLSQTLVSKSGSTTGTSEVDYSASITLFNNKYADYLFEYGILVYEKDNYLNIHSIYSLNDNENYFDIIVYINNDSGMTNNTAITDSRISTALLEVETQLVKENIYPNEYENFAVNFSTEIYFNLSNNNNSYGFTIELNDIEFYINFDTDTKTTIDNFITDYITAFTSMGLNLYSGTTTVSGTTGYTILINAVYPNFDYRTLNVKVNIFSEYEIISLTNENGVVVSGNIINNLGSVSFYQYGLATGMLISVSGSNYTYNNGMYNIIGLTDSIIELSYQGVFIDETTTINIKTESFLRKPRETYTNDVYYSFRFEEPFSESIFFYDFTGEHLVPYNNDSKLTYLGPKPLWNYTYECDDIKALLIDEPNKSIEYDTDGSILSTCAIYDPLKQQTVFRGKDGTYCLNFLLDKYNSTNRYNYTPEPLQVFLGYNSEIEGYQQTTIYMDKVENITYSGYTTTTKNFNINSGGTLEITTNEVNFNFNNLYFKKNQHISIDFIDQIETGQTIFPNYGLFKIDYVTSKKLQLSSLSEYSLSAFTTTASTFYYNINVEPKNILKLNVYGETEIEDERFKINLNNLGITLNYDVEHIFKESDINEQGIDYILLNAKRKEMLSMFPEIYNYIGSYKSLINAINFFGWSDLELYEYYKNVDPTSELYQKLHKVKINDIFDNTVVGWHEIDTIKGRYKDGMFKKTNLFNLTYNITDEDGNNVLIYSLNDIQTKLGKLKRWLKRNIIPLSANLVDITGVADTNQNMYLNFDVSNMSLKTIVEDNTTVINFIISKTLNFENNYLVDVDFYTINNTNPSGWTAKIKTFSLSSDGSGQLIPQKYFKLMKNDLLTYTFNINSDIDQYIYVETIYYNDFGIGQVYNQMINTSTSKNYVLINNNFKVINNQYLNVGTSYYFFDKNGYVYIND